MHLLSEKEKVSESQDKGVWWVIHKKRFGTGVFFFSFYLKEIGFAKFFSPTCPELGGELNFEQ